MTQEIDERPFHQYNQPDFDSYYKDVDEATRLPINLFTYIKKEEFSEKIPAYYRYLYALRKEVYTLNDSVVYHKGDTRNPIPPRHTYRQLGDVFTIKQDAVTFKDLKAFKFQRN